MLYEAFEGFYGQLLFGSDNTLSHNVKIICVTRRNCAWYSKSIKKGGAPMSRKEICFGRNLKILRNSCGMSQQQFADEIHVTRQTLSNWEIGRGKPDIEIFCDICKFFDVSADDMLSGTVRKESFVTVYERDEMPVYWEIEHYIDNISDKGFYTIIDEDLQNFFPIIHSDFEHIIVMVQALKKKGYQLTEVFSNGFSVFISLFFKVPSCEQ